MFWLSIHCVFSTIAPVSWSVIKFALWTRHQLVKLRILLWLTFSKWKLIEQSHYDLRSNERVTNKLFWRTLVFVRESLEARWHKFLVRWQTSVFAGGPKIFWACTKIVRRMPTYELNVPHSLLIRWERWRFAGRSLSIRRVSSSFAEVKRFWELSVWVACDERMPSARPTNGERCDDIANDIVTYRAIV